MARVGLVVTGVVAALLGLVLLAAGVALGLAFGPDGTITSAPARASATGVALLLDDLQVDAVGLPVPDDVGSLTLSASSTDGSPVFLGVAAGADLDTYLAGAPYDVVSDLSAGTTRAVPGTQQPPPPSAQQFWLAQDEGSPAELAARVPAGATVVLMSADATPGVTADLTVRLEVDRAWPTALVTGGAGLVLLVLAVVLVVLGRRRRTTAPPVGAHSTAVAVLPDAVVADTADTADGPSGVAPPGADDG